MERRTPRSAHRAWTLAVVFGLCVGAPADALEPLALDDLDAFRDTGDNWRIAGAVAANPEQRYGLGASAGKGVLVNLPDEEHRANLLTELEHGDLDLELEFMMARGSNSGIYLQGRYEVQLFDSWGVTRPGFSDCAGVYQRRRPDGSQYEGAAPRVNACKAPGLWQTMRIAFRAPRFDAAGEKTENARLLEVVVNGVTVHENLSLSGPTGGPISEAEAALGPLMIQGDHGPVAFRNIRYQAYGMETPRLDLAWRVHYDRPEAPLEGMQGLAGRTPDQTGRRARVGPDLTRVSDGFAIEFEGVLDLPRDGAYTFELKQLGNARLRIDGETVFEDAYQYPWDGPRTTTVELAGGAHDFSLAYVRQETDDWLRATPPGLTLFLSGPALRRTALHRPGGAGSPPNRPIFVHADGPVVLRSFVDLWSAEGAGNRVMKAVNVGDPTALHYTVDLDSGALVQAWRGEFLDASPMWDSRGDGSARPRGALLTFGQRPLLWRNGDAERLRPLGYDLDADGLPTFRYRVGEVTVRDTPRAVDGRWLERRLEAEGPADGMSVLVAVAERIEALDDGWYAIDDRRWYIQLPDGGRGSVARGDGGQRLFLELAPGRATTYRVVF